jgi:hypothetical protein
MREEHNHNGDEQSQVPVEVVAFVHAINAGESDALLTLFAERTLINDEGREYWNTPGVCTWANRIVVVQRLAIEPGAAVTNVDQVALTATVDGAFDKRGMPDPLIVSIYFSLRHGKIVQLVILRQEPAAADE